MGSPGTQRQPLDVGDPRVAYVIALIEKYPSTDLVVSRLARAVNLSSSRLQRIFVLHTGLTLARYIKGVRLRRADDLVCGTFLTIKEIVAAVGLHDESHFVRDFKSSYGFTPTERRRAVRANK